MMKIELKHWIGVLMVLLLLNTAFAFNVLGNNSDEKVYKPSSVASYVKNNPEPEDIGVNQKIEEEDIQYHHDGEWRTFTVPPNETYEEIIGYVNYSLDVNDVEMSEEAISRLTSITITKWYDVNETLDAANAMKARN